MGNIIRRLQDLERALDPSKLAEEAYKVFRDTTPRRSGNARSKTRKVNDEIHANYPYAVRLDQGYSQQAPKGMTEPTIAFIQEYINKQGDR